MGRPVVTTAKGLEGIDAVPGRDLLVEDTPQGIAQDVLGVLDGKHPALGARAQALVEAHYDWARSCARLVDIVSGDLTDTRAEALPSARAIGGGRTVGAY